MLEPMRYSEQNYVLGLLNFFGRVALNEKNKQVLKYMQEHRPLFEDWIQSYLLNLCTNIKNNVGKQMGDSELILQNDAYVSIQFLTYISIA